MWQKNTTSIPTPAPMMTPSNGSVCAINPPNNRNDDPSED